MDNQRTSQTFTDKQLYDIALLKNKNLSWEQITEDFNGKHKSKFTLGQIRHAYRAYGELFELNNEELAVQTLREVHRIKRKNSKTQRQNRKILEQLVKEQDILEAIEDAVAKLNKRKPVILQKRVSNRKKMTLELLLSDIHFGKKTDTFNLAICRKRLRHLTSVVLREVADKKKLFNVERLIVALLGDIIESATMHGLESAKGCEFGNAQQVQEAIISIFEDVLEPLAQLGIPLDVVAVTGNHDRTETSRTFHNPGEENLTWIIYNTLEFMCKKAKYKHIKFHIPKCPYATLQIYSNNVLYEHYDNVKANSRQAMENHMMKRQKQLGRVLHFMRGGHFHEATMYGRGTMITNGSVPGQDSFADVLGFDSEATQTLNFYIETKTRPTSFYESFPIYLP